MGDPWHVRRASSCEDLAAGREVVLAASAATGFPDPSRWPPDVLGPHVESRQADSDSVWVAESGRDGSCIGHALVRRPPADSALLTLPQLAPAHAAGALFELGALAVLPAWHRRGVAASLVASCLSHTRSALPEAVVVSAVWPDGPSAPWAARSWVRLGDVISLRGNAFVVFLHP